MPQPAANPAAAEAPRENPSRDGASGMAASPSVCPFSSPTRRDGPVPFGFGIEAIDRRLPWGGLAPSGVHEFKPDSPRDTATVLRLALTLAARTAPAGRPVLLVLCGRAGAEHGLPYGPGLVRLGLDPGRLLIAEAPRLPDALWSIEEGLRSRALAAVIGLLDTGKRAIAMLAARRLVLAADEGGTPCLLLTGTGGEGLNVAHTRWRAGASPGGLHPLDPAAPGARRCTLLLERCRHGPSNLRWNLEWSLTDSCLRPARPVPGASRRAPHIQ